MGLINNFTQIARSIVLEPSTLSVITLLATSLVNELFGLVPYTILLSGQMIFLGESISWFLLVKLLIFVAIPVGIGTGLGSLLIYGLAYWGGKPAIERFGRYFRLSWEIVERAQLKFQGARYDEIVFFILRSIPFLPGLPISAAAGVVRMNVATYLVLTTLGAALKVMVMCALVVLGAGVVAL